MSGTRIGWLLSAFSVLCSACAAPPGPELVEQAGVTELPTVDLSVGGAFPLDAHLEQADIVAGEVDFDRLFEVGADLFHTAYNGADGIGSMRLPAGKTIARFSAVPPGGGHGSSLSSQSCGGCHNTPALAGAGLAQSNVAGDPNNDGEPPFHVRNTTTSWGNGLEQLLAQEMTEDLQAIRAEVERAALDSPGETASRSLETKGVSFGSIAATADSDGRVTFDLTGLEGIDADLAIRPFGWKGNIPTIRTISVGAAANLMGLQAEELVWQIPVEGELLTDPDADGVERELSVGDVTALVAYGAAQETPQSVARLAELGWVAPPSAEQTTRIDAGERLFEQLGCAGCHVPELPLRDTVFEEPTARGNGHFFNSKLAAREPSYDPKRPLRFDLLEVAQEPRVEAHEGGAIVRLYGDLKRHRMGRQLADPGGPQPPIVAEIAPLVIDGEIQLIDASEFLTPELWGVGTTGTWLHDGRAGTLEEAILLHGEDDPPPVGDPGRSEAQESRDAFAALDHDDRLSVLVFLKSLTAMEAPADG